MDQLQLNQAKVEPCYKRFWRNYSILLWKNWLIRRRSYGLLVSEFLFPLLFIYAMIVLRNQQSAFNMPSCHVQSQSMLSMGYLHYIQSLVCNFNYTCHKTNPKDFVTLDGFSSLIYWLHNLTQLIENKNFRDWLIHFDPNDASQLAELLYLGPDLIALKTATTDLVNWFSAFVQTDKLPNITVDANTGQVSWIYTMRQLARRLCGSQSAEPNDLELLLLEFSQQNDAYKNDASVTERLTTTPNQRRRRRHRRSASRGQSSAQAICNRMKQVFTMQPFIKSWGRLRFLLFGSVAYYPSNRLTRQIIGHAQTQWDIVNQLHHFVQYYLRNINPWLENQLDQLVKMVKYDFIAHYVQMCATKQFSFLPDEIIHLCQLSNDLIEKHLKHNTSSSSSEFDSFQKKYISQLMTYVNQSLNVVDQLLSNCFHFDEKYLGFGNRKDFEAHLNRYNYNPQMSNIVGVVFDNVTTADADVFMVKLRLDPSIIGNTLNYQVFDQFIMPLPRRDPEKEMDYFTSGFIDVQEQISRAIIDYQLEQQQQQQGRGNERSRLHKTNRLSQAIHDIGIELKMFPTPPYNYDMILSRIMLIFPQLMVLSWTLSIILAVKYMVDETETRLDEFMRTFGLSKWLHWFSWLSISAFIMSAVSLPICFVLKHKNILPRSSMTLVFAFIVNYNMSCLAYSILFVILARRANLAAIGAGVCYFVLYLPVIVVLRFKDSLPNHFIGLTCLLPQVSYSIGWLLFNSLEMHGTGAQWKDLWSPGNSGQFVSIGFTMTIIWITIGLTALLAIFGLPLVAKYWLWIRSYLFVALCRRHKFGYVPLENLDYSLKSNGLVNSQCSKVVTPPIQSNMTSNTSSHATPTVIIDGLSKMYCTSSTPTAANSNNKGVLALDNVSMNFYQDQIVVLLGHNGAGKSTLLSILVGQVNATSGDVRIHGHDVQNLYKLTYSPLGYCPQYDILYSNLTIAEHIYLFGALKGIGSKELKRQMDQYLSQLNMINKSNNLTKHLSGGQRRKLSLFLSFVGSSSVILLDEPTASLDPFSRQTVWNLIKSLRKQRTVILSSHHMHETEILADFIAIVARGKLLCSGTSLHLKNQYGAGYRLLIERRLESSHYYHHQASCQSKENDKILAFVQSYVPEARLIRQNKSKLLVSLPNNNALLGRFVVLFQDLENFDHCEDLNITHYELNNSTLEDVYFSITDQHFQNATSLNNDTDNNDDDVGVSSAGNHSNVLHTIDLNPASNGHIPQVDKLNTNLHQGNCVTMMDTEFFNDDDNNDNYNVDFNESQLNDDCWIKKFDQKRITKNGKDVDDDNCDDKEEEEEEEEAEEDVIYSNASSSESWNLKYNLLSNEKLRKVHSNAASKPTTALTINKRLTSNHSSSTLRSRRSKQSIKQRCSWFKLRHFVCRLFQMVLALVSKRYVHLKRQKIAWVIEFVFPSLIILVILVLITFFKPNIEQPQMDLNLDLLHKSNVPHLVQFFASPTIDDQSSIVHQHVDTYSQAFHRPNTLTGIQCLDEHIYKTQPAFTPHCRSQLDNDKGVSNKCQSQQIKPCYQLPTNDLLIDLPKSDIVKYLLDTYSSEIIEHLGGFEIIQTNKYELNDMLIDIFQFARTFDLSELTKNGQNNTLAWQNAFSKRHRHPSGYPTATRHLFPPKLTLRIWYNNLGYTSAVTYLNIFHNLQLRMISHFFQSTKEPTLLMSNYPIYKKWYATQMKILEDLKIDSALALFLVLALSFIPSSFVVLLVTERRNHSKHLQYLSGLMPIVYWIVNYVWDIVTYTISAIICLLLLASFGKTNFLTFENIVPFTISFIFFGLSMIGFIYLMSFVFREPSTAFVFICGVNVLLGTITTSASFFMEFLTMENNRFQAATRFINNVFRATPHFCFGNAIYRLIIAKFFKIIHVPYQNHQNVWQLLEIDIWCLVAQSVTFMTLVVLIEYQFFYKYFLYWMSTSNFSLFTKRCKRVLFKCNTAPSSSAASSRRKNVGGPKQSSSSTLFYKSTTNVLDIDSVVKRYWFTRKPTINKLSFSIQPGECFGLLGSNGAGKSTTYSMLTKLCPVTSGSIYINGYNIVTNPFHSQNHSIGYCPQQDALHDFLTVYETLNMYARLRAIKNNKKHDTIMYYIKATGLERFTNCMVQNLSGGNKRKLSTAIAFLGTPKIVFLDEPSAGMDPIAKRQLWTNIKTLLKAKSAVLFSSHCMEECEILCTRVGLLSQGQLNCVGTPLELKTRFGVGYQLEFEFAQQVANSTSTTDLEHKLEQLLPGFEIRLPVLSRQEYSYDKHQPLWRLFQILKQLNDDQIINYISIRQCSLEDVFINFVRMLEKNKSLSL